MTMDTFMFLFVLTFFCAKFPAQELCPEECNCTNVASQFSVFCRGMSFVNITKKVPPQTIHYHYEALEMEIDLGTANFSHLTSLESLQLSCPYDNSVLKRKLIEIPPSHQKVFWPLQNLKELKLNINWQLNDSLPELFGNFDSLEILDLSATRRLNYTNLITSMRKFQNATSLRVLDLHNTQTLEHLDNGLLLNVSELLEPLQAVHLEELDISYNAIRTVVPGLIQYAPRLKKLKANNNVLIPLITGAFFMEIMMHPTLIEADVSEQGLGEPVKDSSSDNAVDFIVDARNQQKSQLSGDWAQPVLDHSSQLSSLSFKKCFELAQQSLCNILTKECKAFIEVLTGNHELFCTIFGSIVQYSNAIPCDNIPPIKSMLKPNCGGCFVFPMVGSLQIMHAQRLSLYDEVVAFPIFKNKTCLNPNNSWEYLDFSWNREHGYADIDLSLRSTIIGFDALKVMNFSGNRIQLPSADLGHNLPQIEVFDFSFNLIDLNGTHGDFLAGAFTMQELNLARNLVQDIPYRRFSDLYNLQLLNLSGNSLKTFNVDIRNLKYLSFIDLSYNRISSFPVDMMQQLTSHASTLVKKTLKIDLSNNLLLCTCDVQTFVTWVHSAPTNLKFVNFQKYQCLNEHSNEVLFHKINPQHMNVACLGRNFYIGVGVGSGILMSALFAGVVIVIYRKRWCIRYHYFIARNILANARKQDITREYQYDVFVSYNRHDKDWVDEVLQPTLEDEHHIKLCLHERDFELGGPITEQIIGSIEDSRKTLLILSPHFVQSNWCKFEMNMAHQKLFTKGQDVLLLAILKPLDNVEISKTLRALLEKKTYVEWSDNPFGQKLFWVKLISALEVPKRREEHIEDNGEQRDEAPLLYHEELPTNSNPV